MSQPNGSITPQATASGASLLTGTGSKNPFRSRLVSQAAGGPNTSLPDSIAENAASNGERSPVSPIAAINGSRTSPSSPTTGKTLPPLPPRKVGTLNSTTAPTSTQASTSTSPTTPSPSSPPESFTRIFTPPSGPPPTRAQTRQRTLFPPPPPLPQRSQTPPPLPSRRTTLRSSSPPRAGRGRLRSNSSETMRVLAEDLPPAYTPGPDTSHGEQTVDIGPARPFIQDDTAALEESLRRRRQLGGMSGYPGATQQTQQQALGYGGGGRGGLGHLNLNGLLFEILTAGGMRNSPGRSQFRPTIWGTSSGRATTPVQPRITGTPVSPQPTGGSYISRQPTGTPQMEAPRRGWSQYPGQGRASGSALNVHPQTRPSSSSTRLASLEVQRVNPATDVRPTVRATAGRPLLHDGRVLVYPLGHECPKCHNRGYRPMRGVAYRHTPSALVPGDPARPCRKCWNHHARNYEGPLMYADWEGNANGTGGTNYQRPISDPPPPPEASALTPSSPPAHSRTPSDAGSLRSNQVRGPMVVRPGDPRLGGRLCWNCNGTGEVTMLIFSLEQCRVCEGLGRVQ